MMLTVRVNWSIFGDFIDRHVGRDGILRGVGNPAGSDVDQARLPIGH